MEYEKLFLLLGFYTILVEFYIEEVLRGFLPYGFPEENICVYVLVFVSVILLVKIVLRYHISKFDQTLTFVSRKNAPLTDKSCSSSMNGSDLQQMSYNRDRRIPLEVVEI